MTAIPNVTEAGYFGWGVFLAAEYPNTSWPYASAMIEQEAKWIAEVLSEKYETQFEVRQLPEPEWNRS